MTAATVIYHSADFDGLFCREIAKKFLPDAELIGWNFGDKKLKFKDDTQFYVLDLSPEVFDFIDDESRIVWIDHHKTSIDRYKPDIPGYRIDGVAACRLAWQWFTTVDGNTNHGNVGNAIRSAGVLPMIQDFKNRKVTEPLAVRLAGEYDVWDKRDPRAEEFQFGLRGHDLHESDWNLLLSTTGDGTRAAEILCDNGMRIQAYQQKIDADLVTHRSYQIEWEGLKWLVLNTGRFNSLTFAALDKPETGHDALLGYMFNGKVWTVSLYHANHRKDLDLSAIAVKYGGGGHRGASGFTCKFPPFL